MMKKVLALALLSGVISAPAFAQEYSEVSERPWKLSLGAAGAYLPEYKGSDEYEFLAIPVVRASYQFDSRSSLFFNGFEGLGYKYKAGNGWTAGVNAKYRRGREESEDAFLNGMGDVDDTVEIGPFVNYKMPNGVTLGLSHRVGLDSDNDGTVMELSAKYARPLAPGWFGSVSLSTDYVDGDYADKYYSVTSAQAVSGRPEFSAGSGFDAVNLGGHLNYTLNERHSVTMFGNYSHFISDAADSSLTQSSGNAFLALGWAYKF